MQTGASVYHNSDTAGMKVLGVIDSKQASKAAELATAAHNGKVLAYIPVTLHAPQFRLPGEGLCLGVSQSKHFLKGKGDTHSRGAEQHKH